MTASWMVTINTDNPDQIDAAVNISEEVVGERLRQLDKFGDQNARSQNEWVIIEMEELGEVARAVYEINERFSKMDSTPEAEIEALLKNLREEWVQVAAVAMAAIESFDKLTTKE